MISLSVRKRIALGYDNGSRINQKISWEKYHAFDGPVHKSSTVNVQGFYRRNADSSIFFDTPEAVFELCREIKKGNVKISQMNEEQKYLFCIALEKKLFITTKERV